MFKSGALTRIKMLIASILVVLPFASPGLGSEPKPDDEAILELSLEDLLDIEVTSVSKRAQPLHDAAAAIFVITGEDMAQLGVTNVADALRQVPGIHVGRIDSNKWAVTSRGFNGRFSNKLLVLVDGRSVYTTSFSGVYWEVQDMMLEDIDRIEIIRGPGSTLWGANAVNGVINIITKHAADTQGGLVVAGAGDLEKGFGSVRWGEQLSDGTYARFYGKAFTRGGFYSPEGQAAGDDWNMYRAGFRLDSQQSPTDARTLQGDIYRGTIQQRTTLAQLAPPYLVANGDEVSVSGGNVLGRWVHTVSPSSAISSQVYFDRTVRDESLLYQVTNQLDYDFQHYFAAKRQNIVWGLGYRYSGNELQERVGVFSVRNQRAFSLFSAFVQDEIALRHDYLNLTIGSKFEHNDYTGLEIQPSVRLLWRPHKSHRLWAAASRAVRTPMRAEDEWEILATVIPPDSPQNPSPLPVGVMMAGNQDIESGVLVAYEAGYRFVHAVVSADVVAFYNDYTSLMALTPGEPDVRFLSDPPYIALPLVFGNSRAAADYGAELALAWQPTLWLRWNLTYSYLKNDSSTPINGDRVELYSPAHLASLNIGVQPIPALNFNIGLRYADMTLAQTGVSGALASIPSYTTFDLGIGWQLHDDVELSLVGQNLAEKNHAEYAPESFTDPTEVARSFYVKIKWDFR